MSVSIAHCYSPTREPRSNVKLTGIAGATVAIKTAPKPEGPWSEGRELFTATPIDGGLVYAGVAYPYLDESGKTLTIAYTNNNHIQVIKATFE